MAAAAVLVVASATATWKTHDDFWWTIVNDCRGKEEQKTQTARGAQIRRSPIKTISQGHGCFIGVCTLLAHRDVCVLTISSYSFSSCVIFFFSLIFFFLRFSLIL